MIADLICEHIERARKRMLMLDIHEEDLDPPGYMNPDEPIYQIPPEELQPELSIRSDLLAESRDWGHTNLDILPLFNAGIRGAGVVVAICDTGIDYTHPDLADRVIKARSKDFTGSQSGFMDRQSHGTHCAGIVAASSNGAGMIGVAPEASLIACKVLGDSGSGASSWIAKGIRHAVDSGAEVISLSLGGPSADAATRSAVQYATGLGAWVVIAAGNDGRLANSYPGHYPESIAVCATDRNNLRASFSTINKENDISAPGTQIMSTLPSGRYGSMSGTSMATPYVAGCLALVRGALKRTGQPIPKQADLLAALRKTSTDIAPAGVDANTGAGLINPRKLLDLWLTPSNPVPPVPTPEGWTLDLRLTGNGTKPTNVAIVGG